MTALSRITHFFTDPDSQTLNPLALLLVVAAILVPLIGYGLLPLVGIATFKAKLQFPALVKLVILTLVGIASLVYVKRVFERPPYFLPIFLVVYWQVISYINKDFLIPMGIDVHFRLILMIALAVPSIIYLGMYGIEMFKDLPFFKFFMFFFLINVLYYQFYSAVTIDVSELRDGAFAAGNFGLVKLIDHLITAMSVIVTYVTIKKAPNPKNYFLTLGSHLVVITGLCSVLFVLTYPTNLYSYVLDGFLRTFGFLGHPNPYAHHMGMILLVLVGLLFMGQRSERWRIKGIGWGVFLATFGFLVGLSKTAILSFIVASSVFWMPQLLEPQNRVKIVKALFSIAIGLVALNYLFGWLSGDTVLEILAKRLADTNSVDSRMGDWWVLISQINWSNIWFGQGHTAANQAILLQQFNANEGKPVLNVHNGYIEVVYDYGLLGLSVIFAALSILIHGFTTWLKGSAIQKPLGLALIALAIYFLMVLSFDEILYMYDASHMFWIMATILIMLIARLNLNAAKVT